MTAMMIVLHMQYQLHGYYFYVIQVLYHGYNLGIKYKYSLPLPNKSRDMNTESKQSPSRMKVNHGWVRRGWEKCSVVCGNGKDM